MDIIHYSVTIEPEADRRYRMMVVLGRSDRPVNWTFKCPHCTMKVAELINTEVVAMSDMMDMESMSNVGVGVRCDGRFEGGRCSFWYYFNLNEAQK